MDSKDERTAASAPAQIQRARLAAFWDGGYVTHDLPESGALTFGRGDGCDVQLAHASVSRKHAMLHLGREPSLEDLGSANGTRVGGAIIPAGKRVPIAFGAAFEVGSVVVVLQTPTVDAPPRAASGDDTMLTAVDLADRVAPSNITVLILGETGAGKGVLAQRIHDKSPRAGKPFLPINCAALAESLLESELFGHEKGAFTGAIASKPGLIESAARGTVFLDEVGEMPLTTQAKLLRVIESREVMRVGARRATRVDVRFIAATNRELVAAVRAGDFREDLYFRLNGITITVPPLRTRPRELDALVKQFVVEASQAGRSAPTLSAAALAALRDHTWPGNIRELRNVIDRAVVLARDVIEPKHLQLVASPVKTETPERAAILDALARSAGNQTKAAALLGISRRTFLRRLDELNLPRPRKAE